MSSCSNPNPSLLQLKYLHKPCSPPSIPLRLTLATFILLFLHAWHLPDNPVSGPCVLVSTCPPPCPPVYVSMGCPSS